MNKYDRLVSHFPSLYRPEVNEESLFNVLLKELGITMDELSRDLTLAMQSHWFRTADKASYDPHYLRSRELDGASPINLRDQKEQRRIADYPYLHDLARLGALVSISPRREPSALRETVEQYRQRLLRIIMIYRAGLGTLKALRDMVAAELPEDPDLALPAQKRSFSLEENAPFIGPLKGVQSLGLPADEIGPLMRWKLSNTGQQNTAPIVYIEGLAVTDEFDVTERPMIELFSPTGELSEEGGLAGIGLGYLGTIAPGQVLKFEPGFSGCLTGDSGILLSAILGNQVGISGWQTIPDAPTGDAGAVLQTTDKMLWFAVNNSGDQELWRYDGTEWLQMFASKTLPLIHCLQQRRHQLLLGTAAGLSTVELYPETPGDYQLSAIAAYSGQAVFCCIARRSNPLHYYIGTSDGLNILDDANNITQTLFTGTAIRTVTESDGSLYCGGDAGVIKYQHQSQRFYYLSAEFESELEEDWLPFDPPNLPTENSFGLPPVHALHVSDDGSLWVGTELGLARYRARHERDLVYRNLLEGFGDLIDGRVSDIQQDEHGYLWFTSNRGIIRFDGRDLARFNMEENVWQQLGQADQRYQDNQVDMRGLWRFHRTLGRWEIFDYTAKQWTTFAGASELQGEAFNRLLFIDRVVATLGAFNSNVFVKSEDVESSQLVLHCKPDPTRIVTGGVAALPRIRKGDSTWRYLSIEPDDLVDSTDLPWWSTEGRLVLPPDHDAPYAGRYHDLNRLPFQLDQMVFAYNPVARVKIQWANKKPLQVIVRLLQRNENDVIDPAIVDRVWHGINLVRPAGVQVLLAVEGDIVRDQTT